MLRVFLLFLLFFGAAVRAERKGTNQLVDWETQSNNVTQRSNKNFKLYNYEIPLDVLYDLRAPELYGDAEGEFVFEREGKKYVRWVINPDDTKHYKDMERFLKSKGLSTERHQYFQGFYTASRTMVAVGPTGRSYFVKVSTDKTGGQWQDKRVSYLHTQIDRWLSDYVRRYEMKNGPFEHIVPIYDVAAFGVRNRLFNRINQGMLIREMGPIKQKDKYYLPGFSVFSQAGVDIAKKNGSDDPVAYWTKHYAEPLGKAVAELRIKLGLDPTSPHSQNYLVELDENMKPTGKIAIRDFGDTRYDAWTMNKNGSGDIAWKLRGRLWPSTAYAQVGFLHGNKPPPWMKHDKEKPKEFDRAFFRGFDSELTRILGATAEELATHGISHGSYSSKFYPWSTWRKGQWTCWRAFVDLGRVYLLRQIGK